jgi:transformation/transcription domain-associated protein
MATQRTNRPRKSSTAASHPPTGLAPGAPSIDASAASGAGMSTMPPPSFSTSGPTTTADCETLAAQLIDTSVPMRRRLEIASDLRDSAETTRDFAFYEKYLAILIPALLTVLGDEKTVTFSKEGLDQVSLLQRLPVVIWEDGLTGVQRFRHTLLSYIQRLPHSEPFRQHESAVMELMIKLIRVENEENALLCIKIIIDGFRNHKVGLSTLRRL